ncbi:MAG: imidazolonepropionase [Pseudomonadota bacterium]
MSQTLLTNATLACLDDDAGYGLRENAALLVDNGSIAWVGHRDDCPGVVDAEIVDCDHLLVTPGLIDCHTHLVYGGDRAVEFEMRLEGASYQQIAESGGGIVSTVKATREASEESLLHSALLRARSLLKEGVTTLEIKSGYGLDTATEIKMLRVADALAKELDIRVQKTFLGAHALPAEFAGRSDDYIDLVCTQMLPEAHRLGLVDAVDVFVESIAFNCEQGERVLSCARQLGLPVKAHVEQLSDMGGALMAAALSAISVDHLEYLNENDIPKLAKSGVTAVILPGAFYVLGETRLPPIEALRAHQVPMALATDANPGSSPIHSIQLIMNMACTLFRMTPVEALRGVTINAAKALGKAQQLGSLEVGKQADLVLWDIDNPAMLSYRVGVNPCRRIMRHGRWQKLESSVAV